MEKHQTFSALAVIALTAINACRGDCSAIPPTGGHHSPAGGIATGSAACEER
jgi:hypothetical protein